jgi:hypothetical protein
MARNLSVNKSLPIQNCCHAACWLSLWTQRVVILAHRSAQRRRLPPEVVTAQGFGATHTRHAAPISSVRQAPRHFDTPKRSVKPGANAVKADTLFQRHHTYALYQAPFGAHARVFC